MDEFLLFLKERRFLYDSMLRIFKVSHDPLNEYSAVCAEMVVEAIDEIITRYEKFVKEQNDVANLS